MSNRPSILDELGRELVRAARTEQARGARAGRLRSTRRAIVVGLLALLGLAAVAAAASLILGRGDPIDVPRPGLVPVELQPVRGTARLNGLDVRDPDGGPAWDVRTSRGKTGAICATVGQVLDGELGLLGLDRKFRVLPAGAADTCSREQRSGVTLAGARAFGGGGRLGDLTVVSGVAAASVRDAVAIVGERTTRMRLGPAHAFLAIFRGLPEELRPRVVLTEASGKRTTLRFADSGEFVARDPGGGPPWTLRYSARRDGLRCITPQRQPGPESGVIVMVPWRCGLRDQPFVAIRRFVPQRLSSVGVPPPPGPTGVPQPPEFDWVRHPARTLVWGSTARAGGEVVVTGAGRPRYLRADPGGVRRTSRDGVSRAPTGRGGFVAVLDGHVDPRRLRVSIDGRRVDPTRALDLGGQAVGREPVPPWRSVASAADRSSSRDPLRIVPGSASISRRADDPAGGPEWALRSWLVRAATPAAVELGRPRLCFAIGVEQRGRLVEPVPSGGTRPVGMGVDDRRCPRRSELAAGAADFELRSYVDDADASDPRPVRIVVAGLLGDAARSAELLGAGAPRALTLGPHGTFLVILGPEHTGRRLRLRARGSDGLTRTTSALQRSPSTSRCVPTRGQSIRVADPDGGPSWTTGHGRDDGHPCRYTGRAIGNRVATLLEGRNWVLFEAASTSILYTRRPRTAGRPLALNITDPRFASVEPPSPLRSAAQVIRRTLAGRTIVTGSATDAVTAVTLRTPRDIRTIRPGPGGLLLAVYDGVFYGGDVHTIAHMRDGRMITQTFPIGGL